MSYSPPQVNEMIYAVVDSVGVYEKPSKDATRLLTNSENGDHTLRDFRAGDPIGRVLSQQIYPNSDYTEQFIKVQYWTWENQGSSILGLFGKNVQVFHECYIAIADDPNSWVRDTHRAVTANTKELDTMRQLILNNVATTADVPAPISITRIGTTGDEYQLVFGNGYQVTYSDWKKLSAADKHSNTSIDLKSGLTTGDGTGKDAGNGTGFFTKKNIIILASILLLAGTAVAVYILKKKKSK